MTKQTTGLFKPEVYKAMQRRLQGNSKHRDAEKAFEIRDSALQVSPPKSPSATSLNSNIIRHL